MGLDIVQAGRVGTLNGIALNNAPVQGSLQTVLLLRDSSFADIGYAIDQDNQENSKDRDGKSGSFVDPTISERIMTKVGSRVEIMERSL